MIISTQLQTGAVVTPIVGCAVTAAPAAVTTVAALETLGFTISDNCTADADLVVTSNDVVAGTCPIVITRTYTITDGCLNFTTIDQTINIDDNIDPVATGTVVTPIVGCAVTAAPAAVTTVAALETLGFTISDNCTADADLVVTSNDVVAGTCPIVITRTYTITDGCLNFTTIDQTINIDDQIDPVATGAVVTPIVGCAVTDAPAAVTTVAALETLGFTISDNCTADADLVVTSNDVVAGTCPIVITRTYTITDGCLNFTTIDQTINVDDQIDPVATGAVVTPIVGCAVTDAPAAVTAVAALEVLGFTISDNCTADADLVVTSNDVVAGTCPIVITRTYTITDGCLNFTTIDQTINIDDNIDPVATGAVVTPIVGCAVTAAPAAVTTVAALETLGFTISDNCTADADLVVTSNDVVAGTCPIVITRTYTITDGCLNFTTIDQTINIDDNIDPVATGTVVTPIVGCAVTAAPAAVTTVAALETLGFTISDNCTADADLVVTSNDVVAGTCPIVITRTYTITDGCLNFTTIDQTINIDDQIDPVATGAVVTPIVGCAVTDAPAAVTTVAALETLGFTISDNCTADADLVVTSNDVVAGTCPIVITRTYTITDGCLNFTTIDQTINIDDNIDPVATGTVVTPIVGCAVTDAPAAVTTVAALETLGFTISDNCTIDANLVVTSADVVTGTCPIVVTRTYTITDGCLNFTTIDQTINIDDNIDPVATGTVVTPIVGCVVADAPAAVTTVVALEALGFTISDNCTLDANLVVTSADVVTGTCPIVVTRTYTITDGCLNFTTIDQTINIDDNIDPVATGAVVTPIVGCVVADAPAAVTTVAALEVLGFTISDNCTLDANLVVTSADVVTGTCPIVITRTYTITDGCLNFTTIDQTINIDDQIDPVATGTVVTPIVGCVVADAPAAVTTVAALETLGFTISDNCTADADLVVTSNDVVAGTCPIVVTRTYTITDGCLNFTTIDQTINIDDNIDPVATGTVVTPIVGCAVTDAPAAVTTVAALEVLGFTISDNCTADADLVVTSNDVVAGTCPIVITRTYTITDGCLNFTTIDQTINIDDNIDPVATGAVVTPIVGCAVTAAPAAVTTVAALETLGFTISDNCTADADLVVTSNDVVAGTCPIVITRTYTITDGCLNFTTIDQTINIDDNIDPVATGTVVTPIVGCAVTAAPAAVTTVAALETLGFTISDNCTADADLVVTSNDVVAGTCPIVITRTYTITDACLNFTTIDQTINIDDQYRPSCNRSCCYTDSWLLCY